MQYGKINIDSEQIYTYIVCKIMKELELILKELGMSPSSGHGETVLIWKDGEIVGIETLNRQLSKYIN